MKKQLQSIKRACWNFNRGFSLVEAMMAISVFGLLVTILSGVFIYGQRATQLSGDRQQAAFLAEEALEAVRNIRDEDFANLVDGQYGLSEVGGQWTLVASSDTIDKFTRVITISTVDSDRKLINANIQWADENRGEQRLQTSTYLSNWRKVVAADTCPSTCQSLGYDEGTCRADAATCTSNGEVNEASGDAFCTDGLVPVCCCLNIPDTTAPSAISDLVLSNPSSASIDLNWTAPGDDGNTGTATAYDIRYSTSLIDDSNWSAATQLSGEPTPGIAGASESISVTGLAEETTYYFAIKAVDDAGNYSSLSNVPSLATIAGPDTTAPAAISDLALSAASTTYMTLTWTAPGDDGNTKTATSFDIRYSTALITEANWASATQVSGEPSPSTPGTIQSMVVTGLSSYTTYYFAIKTSDEAANVSDISNVPNLKTLILVNSCPNLCISYGYTGGVCGSSEAAYCATYDDVSVGASSYCSGNYCCCGPIPDTVAPAAVTNLTANSTSGSTVGLSWRAPGDNGSYGVATAYDIRFATTTITEANWNKATAVSDEPMPTTAGNTQSMTVDTALWGTTVYFGIKTYDEVANASPLSNITSKVTEDLVAKVLCTDAYRKGYIPESYIIADYQYADKYANRAILRGYHSWGKPVVRIIQNNLKLAKRVYPFTVEWSKHTAYEMGVIKNDSPMGKMLIETAFPLCEELGNMMIADGQLDYEFSDKDVEDVMEKYYQDYYNLGLSEEELVPLVKKDFEKIMSIAKETYLADRASGFTMEKVVYEKFWFFKFMDYIRENFNKFLNK